MQVASAATPALPFILEILDTADLKLTVELLDILLGLALGVSRKRRIELGHSDAGPDPQWLQDLRLSLNAELRFESSQLVRTPK